MHNPPRDGKALPWSQLSDAVFEVDQDQPVDDIEKLVLFVMLVLAELSLHDAEPDHAIVDTSQRLVGPLLS
jgi:hypothetical protein